MIWLVVCALGPPRCAHLQVVVFCDNGVLVFLGPVLAPNLSDCVRFRIVMVVEVMECAMGITNHNV